MWAIQILLLAKRGDDHTPQCVPALIYDWPYIICIAALNQPMNGLGGPSTRPGPTVFYDIAQEELSVLPIF